MRIAEDHAPPEPDLNGVVQSAFTFLNRRKASMVLMKRPMKAPVMTRFSRLCSDAVQRRRRKPLCMNRIRILLLAGLIAAAPMAEASARALEVQARDPLMGSFRQDRAREESREGRRLSASEVARSVSRGREGRMLGINERNMGGRPVYVVRWEYPGGRVADITVDARTGAVIGER
jgi:hypothetical protein